jgi:hypothetical protein
VAGVWVLHLVGSPQVGLCLALVHSVYCHLGRAHLVCVRSVGSGSGDVLEKLIRYQ